MMLNGVLDVARSGVVRRAVCCAAAVFTLSCRQETSRKRDQKIEAIFAGGGWPAEPPMAGEAGHSATSIAGGR
jgi:hypothetical protein